jgi:hypothetical protein
VGSGRDGRSIGLAPQTQEVAVTEVTLPAVGGAPAWVAAEMPPGYQTRLFEIQRLSADLHAMDLIGRVLWETGDPLKESVAAIFATFECAIDAEPGTAGAIVAKLGPSRRLLLVVSSATSQIQKTSEALARAFQAVQFASDGDRTLLVAGHDRATPPAERPDPLAPDALDMLERMGVNVLTTAALFRLWRLSLEDKPKARKVLDALHDQDGGVFVVPGR